MPPAVVVTPVPGDPMPEVTSAPEEESGGVSEIPDWLRPFVEPVVPGEGEGTV